MLEDTNSLHGAHLEQHLNKRWRFIDDTTVKHVKMPVSFPTILSETLVLMLLLVWVKMGFEIAGGSPSDSDVP